MLFKVKSVSQGRFIVIITGIIWSTGGPVVRLVEDATKWQFLFYRSLGVFISLMILIKLQNGIILQTLIGGAILLQTFLGFRTSLNLQPIT